MKFVTKVYKIYNCVKIFTICFQCSVKFLIFFLFLGTVLEVRMIEEVGGEGR